MCTFSPSRKKESHTRSTLCTCQVIHNHRPRESIEYRTIPVNGFENTGVEETRGRHLEGENIDEEAQEPLCDDRVHRHSECAELMAHLKAKSVGRQRRLIQSVGIGRRWSQWGSDVGVAGIEVREGRDGKYAQKETSYWERSGANSRNGVKKVTEAERGGVRGEGYAVGEAERISIGRRPLGFSVTARPETRDSRARCPASCARSTGANTAAEALVSADGICTRRGGDGLAPR